MVTMIGKLTIVRIGILRNLNKKDGGRMCVKTHILPLIIFNHDITHSKNIFVCIVNKSNSRALVYVTIFIDKQLIFIQKLDVLLYIVIKLLYTVRNSI